MRVISIVGRFLEHSRVYYFHNGGDEEYYIGSADAMRRNLENRVEVVTPIESRQIRQDLLDMLEIQLSDQRSAWEMQFNGTYVQRQPVENGDSRSSQALQIEQAEKRSQDAKRLRRRKAKSFGKRNLR